VLIRNATILAMESAGEAPMRGDISIAGDRIAAIAPGLEPAGGEEVTDATGCIVKQADLVLLRADRSDAAPLIDPYGTVVLRMDRSHVDTVLVAGKVRKRGGVAAADHSALVEQAQATVERLRSAGLFVTPSADDEQRSGDRAPAGRTGSRRR
jgi:cytosine/adenosine deaminase-related metal-dependent hydrolase